MSAHERIWGKHFGGVLVLLGFGLGVLDTAVMGWAAALIIGGSVAALGVALSGGVAIGGAAGSGATEGAPQ